MILEELTHFWFTLKANSIKLMTLVFIYLSPIQLMALFVLGAIFFDTLMGRWAAKSIALREGKVTRLEVTSRKTRVGFISKALTYIGLLVFVFFIDKTLFNDLVLFFIPNFPISFLVTKGLGIILILLELDSVDEKLFKVKGIRLRELIISKVKGIKSFVSEAASTVKEVKDAVRQTPSE
jgi:hypothetical protein